jgi:transcription elongation factor Elf1
MPRDRLDDFSGQDEDEDRKDKKSGKSLGTKRRFEEFECPVCSANNPCDVFGDGDELICNWCGLSYKALVDDEGNLRLKEL